MLLLGYFLDNNDFAEFIDYLFKLVFLLNPFHDDFKKSNLPYSKTDAIIFLFDSCFFFFYFF